MPSRPVLRAVAGLMIAALMAGRVASAAPPSGGAPTERDREARALALAEEGSAHFDKGEYREAYEALQRSLGLVEKRGVMALAASSLRELGRYDEALSLYEKVLSRLPDTDPRSSFRKKVEGQIAELQGLVGTLVVAGDAPRGATLFVDDRSRGVVRPAEPLRVSAGTLRIRVEKEGFDPIVATVEVKGGQKSVAELVATSRKGRLVVTERHSWPLRVELNGKEVGVTPWEGLVEVGEHRVRLRGLVDLDVLEECAAPEAGAGGKAEVAKEGAKVASAEQAATVRLYETTRLMLGAEELDASLRIESTPGGAVLFIDYGMVGLTPWQGRLGLGEHVIEVSAKGFVAAKQSVRLERRKQRELTIALERRRPPAEALVSGRTVAAGVAYGMGALGLGVFAVTGIVALDKKNGLDEDCKQRVCVGDEIDRLDTAETLATVSTMALVIGGLGVTTGTGILVARPQGHRRGRSTAAARSNTGGGMVWSVGFSGGGVEVKGRF